MADAEGSAITWVSAASPRLRAAFGVFVKDASCQAYKEKAEGELLKHEQAQRIGQLADRRKEQADELKALTKAIDVQGVEEAFQQLQVERQETIDELKRVRAEYDQMKWKGRWVTK